MIVVSPACSDERLTLRTRDACEVVNSVGTQSYGDVCFAMLERALNAEHWALFRFRSGSPLKCVATASKRDKAAAKENCESLRRAMLQRRSFGEGRQHAAFAPDADKDGDR